VKRKYSLKGRDLFKKLYREGKRVKGNIVDLIYLRPENIGNNFDDLSYENSADIKIGIVVKRRVGKAVERNKIKRRIRSVLQEMIVYIDSDLYMIVNAKKKSQLFTYKELYAELERLLVKRNIIHK